MSVYIIIHEQKFIPNAILFSFMRSNSNRDQLGQISLHGFDVPSNLPINNVSSINGIFKEVFTNRSQLLPIT